MAIEKIMGELATGVGEATGFTQLDWAKDAFRQYLSLECYPGTVNVLATSDQARAAWERVCGWNGIILPPPQPEWCASRAWHARINGEIPAAAILPDVDSYPATQIELIAPVAVRDTLGLKDGDPVTVEISDGTEAI